MLISSDLQLQGAQVVREIGRITATSSWRGQKSNASECQRDNALNALIKAAKDFEADAIIGLDYVVDAVRSLDLTSVPLERIAATGIAVKLARA